MGVERSRRDLRRRPRRLPSAISVLGELMITAGVVALLYVGWQLWFGDMIYGAQANQAGQERLQEWADAVPDSPPSSSPTSSPFPAEPPVLETPADTEVFAVMQIPRFGNEYAFDIAGGVTRAGTLDQVRIGHYLETEMPGEEGNFALAGHRTTYGAPFNRLAELHTGDPLVVATPEGWFIYRLFAVEGVARGRRLVRG